jgi:hypothetical protein
MGSYVKINNQGCPEDCKREIVKYIFGFDVIFPKELPAIQLKWRC